MNLSLKPHPLVAHWTPGVLVLTLFALSHFNWNYKAFTDVCARNGLVVSVTVLLLSVGAFLIGELLDSVRDLLESIWDQIAGKVNWYYFMKEIPDKTEQFNDYYYTYYVLNANLVLALLLSVVLILLGSWLFPGYLFRNIWVFLGACISAGIFFFDAKSLREYIVKITNRQDESQ